MKNLEKQVNSILEIYKKGNLALAERACIEVLNKNPNIVFLHNLMGLIYAGQKKFDKAIKFYEMGIKIDPNFAIIYNNLGLLTLAQKLDDSEVRAENYYKKSISLDKNIPEPLNNLGSLYTSSHKYDEAIECYKKAIALNPKFSPAYYNLGKAYLTIGKLIDAKNYLKKAIELNSNFSHAHRTLSRILKYDDKEKHLDELEASYNHAPKDSPSKMDLAFALGKAYEDLKKFDKSFNFYEEANLLRRKNISFSMQNEKETFQEIKNYFTQNLFSKFNESGCKNSNPIFILGMPRSGTTLVEQIISNHPRVFGADEVNFIPSLIKKKFNQYNFEDFKKIGNEYINKMKKLSNNSDVTTDKLPINFYWIGFIKLILPNSKIIHCHRNPKDNILSIFKNHFPGGKVAFAYDLNEIVEYYNMYSDLMKHWNKTLPSFIHNIKYENLIENTKSSIQNLLKFCDLKWSDKCLNFYENKRPIQTASDVQARSKIYNHSVDSWKNYEKHLSKYFSKLNN